MLYFNQNQIVTCSNGKIGAGFNADVRFNVIVNGATCSTNIDLQTVVDPFSVSRGSERNQTMGTPSKVPFACPTFGGNEKYSESEAQR